MTLNRRLKELREKWGVSQKEMANRLGIATSTYQYYERGERDVPSEVVRTLTTYKVDANWLITGNEVEHQRECCIPKNDRGEELVTSKTVDHEHAKIIRQFSDKYRAKEANADLLTLEKLNPTAFVEVCAYIKGMVQGLQTPRPATKPNNMHLDGPDTPDRRKLPDRRRPPNEKPE